MESLLSWLAGSKFRQVTLGQGTYEGKWCWFCMLSGKTESKAFDTSAIAYADTAENAVAKALLEAAG